LHASLLRVVKGGSKRSEGIRTEGNGKGRVVVVAGQQRGLKRAEPLLPLSAET
jgi:hypothetical protein